jgi:ribosomal protein S18
MKADKFYRVLGAVITAAVFLMLLAGLAGCNAGQKAVAKYKASSLFSKECADSFPITGDTFFRYYDSTVVFVNGSDTITKTVSIPGKTKTVRTFIHDTIRISKVDTRQVEYLSRTISEREKVYSADSVKQQKQIEKISRKLSRNKKAAFIGWGIVSVYGIIRLWPLLSGLFGGLPGFFIGLISKRRK